MSVQGAVENRLDQLGVTHILGRVDGHDIAAGFEGENHEDG